MNAGEMNLCDWRYGRSGSFYESLFNAISKADGRNLYRLEKGFPEEVSAFHNYAYQDGYWQQLEKEYLKGEKNDQ